MKNQTKFFFIALSTVVLSSGCTKEEQYACTMEFRSAHMNFNVLDAGTGKDLFFSNDPQFTTDQIGFFKTKDKLFKDPIRLEVIGSGTARHFKIQIDNTKPKDTLIMRLPMSTANSIGDILTYTVKKTEERCPYYVLDKAKLNDIELVETNGKLTFKRTAPVPAQ